MRAALSLAVLAFALAAGTARAQTPPQPPAPPAPHDLIRAHAEELGIAPEVVDRVQQIANASRMEHLRLQQDVDRQRLALDILLQVDEPDRKAVLEQVERLGDAESAMLRQSLIVLLDMRAQLTPVQRDALEDLLSRPPQRPSGAAPQGAPVPPSPPGMGF